MTIHCPQCKFPSVMIHIKRTPERHDVSFSETFSISNDEAELINQSTNGSWYVDSLKLVCGLTNNHEWQLIEDGLPLYDTNDTNMVELVEKILDAVE